MKREKEESKREDGWLGREEQEVRGENYSGTFRCERTRNSLSSNAPQNE